MSTATRQLCDGAPASQAEFVAAADWSMRADRWLEAARLWELARGTQALDRDARVDVLSIAQQALCVSKERGALRADEAFATSVQILEAGGLSNTTDQETLGIAGGIYKRYWDVFRQPEHLQRALAYYERGATAGGLADNGYTAVNAAYVADVLAHTEDAIARQSGAGSESAERRRQLARGYRERIVAATATLEAAAARPATGSGLADTGRAWWILVTLAEAHFGLGRYDGAHYARAETYLRTAMELPRVAPWMIETTARQLGAMARIQEEAGGRDADADSRPWHVLGVLTVHVPSLRTELGGKVGLALSGGGFRASLFHIGVLARLAELDMLRHVEVMSCVSGGSILGIAYYLKVRELLNARRDDEITPADYVAIVRALEREFLQAVQENNFRMRMVERFSENLRMLGDRASRTEALGRAMGRVLCGPESRLMTDIGIAPPDGESGLRPVDYNWRRRNKVPLLVLNATNQAGGHPWQFTPYEMGEPQLSAIDSNPQLARRRYADDFAAPHVWRAVVASACVPVLFEPVRVVAGDRAVDLLDGGVHDNQGTSALLDHDCTLLLVSDASGQLSNDTNAGTSFAAVGLRADEIVQERLRIALYESLAARRRGALLRGMLFLHLRLGLASEDGAPTPYGISTSVQRRLSAVRTDLDVFNDAEAFSLMVSGYRMARQQFPVQLEHVQASALSEGGWAFLRFEDAVMAARPSPRLLAALDLSAQRLFKAWRAVPLLRSVGRIALGVGALAALGLLIACWRSDRVIPVSAIAWAVISGIGAVLAERFLRVKVPNWKKELAFVALALSGSALARIHARWLDPAYLRAGRLDRM
jgi:predicted acylesterase/phospholipase RssA